jgi:hypothetical protein
MVERMIITDVSRMHSGACIAGYSDDLSRSIRPVLQNGGGFDWSSLRIANGTLLAPFSVVEIEAAAPRPDPPHCEDVVVEGPSRLQYLGKVPRGKVPVALEHLAFDSVAEAFGSRIQSRRSIPVGVGERSLATIRVRHVDFLKIDCDQEDWTLKLRVAFRDLADDRYDLPVTDIGLRSLCHHILASNRHSPDQAAARIRGRLNRSQSLFIRVGASRPFSPAPGRDAACFLLATGIYSTPDFHPIPWPKLFSDELPIDLNPLPEAIVDWFEQRRAELMD